MKILLIHNFYRLPGGEDTVFQNEAELLREHGNEVIIYTRSNQELDEMNFFRKLLFPLSTVFSMKTYREVRQILKKEKIDIVHVHNTLSMVSPAVFYAACFCKVPVVQTLHNFRMECPNALFFREGSVCEECLTRGLFCAVKHRCYRNNAVQSLVSACILKIHRMTGIYRKVNFICLSKFNCDKLLALNSGGKRVVDEKKVFIKPNFINAKFLKIKRIPSERRKNQYLYAGRLEEAKGIRSLLESWDKSSKDKLIICGTGPLEKWCHDYVNTNGIKNIVFMGQVTHEKVIELLRESKALFFPSVCYEGQPMGIIESFALGTPVIGNPVYGSCGNVRELLSERVFTVEEGLKRDEFLPERNYEILMGIYEKICHSVKAKKRRKDL